MAIAPTIRSDADQQILEFLYRRYFPELRATAEKRVRDPHLAEDLAQESFRRAAERGHLADIESRRGYMYAVMEHLRQELARLKDAESAVLEVDSSLAFDAAEFPKTFSPGMTELECAAELTKLVRLLTGRRAEVFQRSLDGLSYAEIALQLGISKEAVAQDLMHARRELSELMNLSGGAGHAKKP